MALNICTQNHNLKQTDYVVCMKKDLTIEDVMDKVSADFNKLNGIIKVLNDSGETLTFWYNDNSLDAALKQCDCMMRYEFVEIPLGMINEKYICFTKVNELTIKFALFLKSKTDKIPLFKKEDNLKYKLPYLSPENIEDKNTILQVNGDDVSLINNIGIFNEQRNLLEKVCELRAQGVHILTIDVPTIDALSRPLTEDEAIRFQNKIRGFSIPKEAGDEIEIQLKKVYGDENYKLYRDNKIANINQYYRGYECMLEDLEGEYSNVVGGLRLTTDAPNNYKNHIDFLGPCIVGGMFCKDSETIPSVIQRLLNTQYPDEYLVINYGTCGFYRSYIEKLDKLFLKQGDIIVVIDSFCDVEKYCPQLYKQIDISLKEMYEKGKDNLFFEIPIHMSAKGNQIAAEYIYSYVNCILERVEEREKMVKIASEKKDINDGGLNLDFYRREAKRLERSEGISGKKNGAVIMNCNPFTNGHKYLIDVARKQVDNLIVFVVEEDKSFFKFKDRKRMVELGTKEFDNVIVISSGNLVLSNLTMPEYFNKDRLQEVIVNPTKDVEIFAKKIAPIFNISYRFVGEEPIDKVTAQYNRTIKEICPIYGIKVEEISRAKHGGGGN